MHVCVCVNVDSCMIRGSPESLHAIQDDEADALDVRL